MATQLTPEDLSELHLLLRTLSNSVLITHSELESARELQDKISIIRSEAQETERKRNVISNYFHQSLAHPAIRQMSADRINQIYDRLVEVGKFKEGEN
ncbi:hypothetical protein SEA_BENITOANTONIO_56 [Arthrobacter phage BenitoAntonio]|nr:hypothetical protein SEA_BENITOANTONIO_56 [Arthrobacter phage BenitoAntonio]